jgi:hypothetical protein
MALINLNGTTVTAVRYSFDDHTKVPSVRSAFFKPYTSPQNVLGRTTSIVTDSLVLGSGSVFFALKAAWDLLLAIKNLVTLDISEAKENFSDAGINLLIAGMFLITAVLSPLINLVDLIAGAVTSLLEPKNEEKQVSPNYA